MKKTGYFLIYFGIISVSLTQSFQMEDGVIEGYASSPVHNKIKISTEFSMQASNQFYDFDGYLWKDGDVIGVTQVDESTTIQEKLKFDYKYSYLNLHFDFINDLNAGVFCDVPFILNRKLNGTQFGGVGLGDIKFGAYFIWKEIFRIQRIKSSIYYKIIKSGLLGELSLLETSNDLKSIGFDISFDYLISNQLRISFKNNFTNVFQEELVFSGENKTINSFFVNDLKILGRFLLFDKIDIGIEYFNNSLSFLNNEYLLEAGNFSGISPVLGYSLFHDVSYGFINIQNINLIAKIDFVMDGRSIYKYNQFNIRTSFFFN